MNCFSCKGTQWEFPEFAVAIYTTKVGNPVPLCATCLSMWLRNAAVDFELAPTRLVFL